MHFVDLIIVFADGIYRQAEDDDDTGYSQNTGDGCAKYQSITQGRHHPHDNDGKELFMFERFRLFVSLTDAGRIAFQGMVRIVNNIPQQI